ncbi:MAG: hypothetical protein AVDCRST_MAG68-3779, partial [uncultured Gemmatimonadetes bacterium]
WTAGGRGLPGKVGPFSRAPSPGGLRAATLSHKPRGRGDYFAGVERAPLCVSVSLCLCVRPLFRLRHSGGPQRG